MNLIRMIKTTIGQVKRGGIIYRSINSRPSKTTYYKSTFCQSSKRYALQRSDDFCGYVYLKGSTTCYAWSDDIKPQKRNGI